MIKNRSNNAAVFYLLIYYDAFLFTIHYVITESYHYSEAFRDISKKSGLVKEIL